MKIPQELPRPEKPTAMVVADTKNAKIFLAKDDNLEMIDQVAFEKDWLTDSEGGFAQHGSQGEIQSFGNPPVAPDEDRLLKDKLCKSLNDKLLTMYQNKEFGEWLLAAPDYALKTIENEMHNYLKDRLVKKEAANLINEPPLEIWQRFFK